ncbi:MAG: DnaJ domain-containing protein, partial [Polyangiaceae bacterium]|nr:DnaJ domain-containing protein [Polyangiaceae bacterium]
MNDGELYSVLGVGRNATSDEIKQAYRRLARLFHPDRNQHDPFRAEEGFRRVAYAYEVLSDPRKRRLYDKFGTEGLLDGFAPGFVARGGARQHPASPQPAAPPPKRPASAGRIRVDDVLDGSMRSGGRKGGDLT